MFVAAEKRNQTMITNVKDLKLLQKIKRLEKNLLVVLLLLYGYDAVLKASTHKRGKAVSQTAIT